MRVFGCRKLARAHVHPMYVQNHVSWEGRPHHAIIVDEPELLGPEDPMARSLLMTTRVPARTAPRRKSRTTQGGFTLVEMAIVVVIIGILAVLAVVGYRRLILSSNMTEATHMV